jgi:hypothetical protein
MGAKLFHEGGRTDMMELIVALHNFGNGPEKICFVQSAENGAGPYSAPYLISTGSSFTTVQVPGHTKRTNHVPLVPGF